MKEPSGDRPSPPIDWESFYRNYRKPGYIPGYEIHNKLGGGVFGLVFKARKQSIGKDYAIKFLKVDDRDVRRAVLGELDAVRHFAQVDHPNLVSIEDKGEVDGIPYIIMAFAGTETLHTRLQSENPDRMGLLYLFLQACRGVQALHERSLVHFDLKPANIFLRGDVARVGDYGLSKMVTASRNSLSMGRGTPYYMAPEMLRRKGDHRSDIYSLGVILYECLTGKLPFLGSSEWEVLDKHENAPLTFPPDLEPGYQHVIERCMRKDPDERWRSVTELVTALRRPAAGQRAAGAAATESAAAAADSPISAERSRVIAERALARARRRSNGRLVLVVLLVMIGWGTLSLFTASRIRPARGYSNVAMPRAPVARAGARSKLPVLHDRDRDKIGHFSGQPHQLPALNPPPGVTSGAWSRTKEYVANIARGDQIRRYTDGLKSDPYAAFIAALNYLRKLDYGDLAETRQAVRLQHLLKELTLGISHEITAPPSGLDHDRIRRNAESVERWFLFLVDYACDRDAFDRALESRERSRARHR